MKGLVCSRKLGKQLSVILCLSFFLCLSTLATISSMSVNHTSDKSLIKSLQGGYCAGYREGPKTSAGHLASSIRLERRGVPCACTQPYTHFLVVAPVASLPSSLQNNSVDYFWCLVRLSEQRVTLTPIGWCFTREQSDTDGANSTHSHNEFLGICHVPGPVVGVLCSLLFDPHTTL